ncbi:MAG: hypothetical protein FD126_902 [Elusimicrobia bacterium]|nr:MAG: hypothetical protein FD126_902 [Elusimicrobiota bacterium]
MFKTAALSVAAGLAGPRLAPPPLKLTLPTAPALVAPRLAAPVLSAPLLPTVNAAQAPKPAAPPDDVQRVMDRAPRMMELQAALLRVAAAHAGQDITTLSVGMALVGNGLSLADFDAMLAGLDELGADLPEAADALEHEFATGNMKGLFAQGRDPRNALSLLAAVMRDIAYSVEIRRNNRFLSWFWDYEAGRKDGGPDFSTSGVRALSRGRVLVTFGTLDGHPLRVTMATLDGRGPNARRWFEGVLRSPFTTPERAAALDALRVQLAAFGLLGN